VVTDWMQITKAAQQRLCFFNMHIDKFGLIKCVEKQNYTTEKDDHHVLDWSLTPDGTFSGLFNVTCQGIIDKKSPHTLLKLQIKVTAEGGGGWGLGSIVESTAAEVVKKYYGLWIHFVLESLEKHNMSKLHENHSTKNISENNLSNSNANDDNIKSRKMVNSNLNENNTGDNRNIRPILHNNNWPISFDLQNSNYPPSLLPNVNKSRESLMKKYSGSPRIALKTINYPYDIEGQKKFKPKVLRSRSQKITTVITIVSVVLISAVFIFVLLYYNHLKLEETHQAEE
jgi:hypothetical protein